MICGWFGGLWASLVGEFAACVWLLALLAGFGWCAGCVFVVCLLCFFGFGVGGVVWFLVCGLLVIVVSGVFFVWSLVVDYFGLRFGSGFDCGFLVLVRCLVLCGNAVFRGV